MRLVVLVFALLVFPASALASDSPPEFASHSFVVLKKGPNWTDVSTPENDELQKAHLDHMYGLWQEGKLLVAGPVSDQPDDAVRGFCVYGVPVEEARKLAEADPRVQAGHLQVEVMTWWTEKDAISFKPAPKPEPKPEPEAEPAAE